MENKKAVKLTDFQKNEENPFMKQAIEGIENHVVKKYKSNSGGDKRAVVALADTETGEVFKTSFIRQIEVDEEQFTKLYLSNFAAFFDLSQAAIRVFGYFMTCMKPKNDLIIFNRKKCLEYTKYKTDKAVYKGLAELVKAEIIARGPADNLWFINPLIVFNGDRVTFAKTYVRKKTLAARYPESVEGPACGNQKSEQYHQGTGKENRYPRGLETIHQVRHPLFRHFLSQSFRRL